MTTKTAKSKPTECWHSRDILLRMTSVFACCKLKTSQKDQSQTSLPAETFPFREGKSSFEILKEKSDNQHVYSNWREGGGGRGGGNKDINSLTHLILFHCGIDCRVL